MLGGLGLEGPQDGRGCALDALAGRRGIVKTVVARLGTGSWRPVVLAPSSRGV
jgi:hypothetical protein